MKLMLKMEGFLCACSWLHADPVQVPPLSAKIDADDLSEQLHVFAEAIQRDSRLRTLHGIL